MIEHFLTVAVGGPTLRRLHQEARQRANAPGRGHRRWCSRDKSSV